MPPSRPKRRRGGSARSRGRKKQKRLDAIHDVAPVSAPPAGASVVGGRGGESEDSDAEGPRRSTRVRRAPALLDTSPLPSPRRKRARGGGGGVAGSSGGSSRRRSRGRARGEAGAAREIGEEEEEEEDDEAGNVVWRSRLRDRVKGKAKLDKRVRSLWFDEDYEVELKEEEEEEEEVEEDDEEGDEEEEEEEEQVRTLVVDLRAGAEEETMGEGSGSLPMRGREVRDREINLTIDLNVEEHEAVEGVNVVEEEDGEKGGEADEEKGDAIGPGNDLHEGKHEEERDEEGLHEKERTEELGSAVLEGRNGDELPCNENNAEDGTGSSHEHEHLVVQNEQTVEESNLCVEQQMELDGSSPSEQLKEVQQDVQTGGAPNVVLPEEAPKEGVRKFPVSEQKQGTMEIKEGRRCGLCGGGTDGRPPKVALHDTVDSDNEAYEGALPSEDPNYDMWDGFGDDPGWLGRLLGPIHDQFGIARVWVHQNCAVWSPEVYFAGLGCLKNVRAALCRGRLLKCSRCGRPGATIGCRVDRCPKTYHLPCSRAEACIFDHRMFLIACNDHRHYFQPQGDKYVELLRKMKIKKMKADIRKVSHDAWRKDIEAEEKWLENCGEDEEFLKREGKRLNRDLSRIAPVYIGGTSENEKAYCGWESVAGLSNVIQSMKEVVILPLLYPEFLSSLGLTPPRGVLLHGHPGTGKTLVVRALIGACSQGNRRIAYFARKGADCLGKYVGDAERQLRLLFQVAERCQPSIIFFDEIDGLAPSRSRRQDQTHNSVVATLLSLLDGLKSRGSVIVIGATNRPDAIDPALRRPGRFDREIYFPLPTFEDRSAILSLHTKNWPSPISGAFLSVIASQTVGYAGADLQSICTQAAINALKRTCPLKEILLSAEKGFEHGRLPLPSILVEERDWLAALAAAPPPCSQREAGIAANDLVSSPLVSYLVPCLLKPLLHLFISLYLDERIWLPSSLLKAFASIKQVIFSSMEKNNVPHTFWSSYLPSLIQQKGIAKRIASILSSYGLIAYQLGNHDSVLNHNEQHEKFDAHRLNSTGSHPKGGLAHKLSGFRALAAGAPRSGQQHLIRCLLHGFVGHTVIHKLDLATMAQEGNGDILSGLTQILQHTIPRFSVNVDSYFTWDEVIDACCLRISHDLVQQHVQLLHDRAHNNHDEQKEVFVPMEISAPGEHRSSGSKEASMLMKYPLNMDKHPSCGVSSREHPTQLGTCSAQQEPPTSNVEDKEDNTEKIDFNEKVTTNCSNRIVKDSESLAIIAFGIQILQHPQFSKLCWVTSKLREGPCTDINGPWKGWPFNSCLLQSITADKSLSGGNNVLKGKEKIPSVRGLVAVGLLAYRGAYASVLEVCSEVRKVLELLVGQVRTKILEKRSRYRYFHILSQVAYLDDIMSSWAYTFQRLHSDNRRVKTGPKVTVGKSSSRECQGDSNTAEANTLGAPAGCSEAQGTPGQHRDDLQVIPAHCPSEMQENSVQHAPGHLEIHDIVCDLDNDNVTSISSINAVEPDLIHSASLDVHTDSLTPADAVINDGQSCGVYNDGQMSRVINGEENRISNIERPESHTVSVADFNELQRKNAVSSSTSTDSAGTSRNMVSSEAHGSDNERNTDFPVDDVKLGHLVNPQSQDTMKSLSVLKPPCLYKCCPVCFNAVYKMVHDILSNSVRPSLHCLAVDDMHDLLSSWSVNLLATVRKWYTSQGIVGSEENSGEGHCVCSSDNGCVPRECTCHLESNGDAGTIKDESYYLSGQPLSFFFKDGVLIPPDITAPTTLHCSYMRLCVCSIPGSISMFNRISS
uniref:PHD-type domain-containing protein n=1 Tax=Oryza meridionalis TaxID=40149 RepID=A0A0E0C5T4_9ORYZ